MKPGLKLRRICAGLTGLAGLAVAISMTTVGGQLSLMLPDGPYFHISAFFGAALAGFALSDGLGRQRPIGFAIGCVAAIVATALGAALGALPFSLLELADAGSSMTVTEAVTGAPYLGWFAIIDGITTSPVVALVWGLSMLWVHLAMQRKRRDAAMPRVF